MAPYCEPMAMGPWRSTPVARYALYLQERPSLDYDARMFQLISCQSPVKNADIRTTVL